MVKNSYGGGDSGVNGGGVAVAKMVACGVSGNNDNEGGTYGGGVSSDGNGGVCLWVKAIMITTV